MKFTSLFLFLIPILSFSQPLNEQQVRLMVRTASEPELILENASLIIENRLYLAEIIIDKLLKDHPENANFNYKKGLIVLKSTSDYRKARPFFLKAITKVDIDYDFFSITDTTCSNEIYFYLANCYHLEGNIKKAIEYYSIVLNFKDKESDLVKEANLKILQCNVALKLIENPKKTIIKNIGGPINSSKAEYSPIISLDGQALYFTSRRPWADLTTDNNEDPLLNVFPEDIYVSYKDLINQDTWTKPVKLPFCETLRNEATIAVSSDEKRIYVYQDNVGGGDIFYSDFETNSFQQVKPLEYIDVNTKYWETHCTITTDGLNMYFVSDRPGGFGGRDIYRVVKMPDGTWSEPKNLGSSINTPYDEDAPFIGSDNKTLHYSSNGPESMGGFDIFLTLRDEDNNWSLPLNLGYPINSTGDDIFFTTTIDGKRGYFSSFREGGLGEKDIYEIQNDELGLKNISVLRGVIKTAYKQQYPKGIFFTLKCIDCEDKTIKTITPREVNGSFFQTLESCKNYETVYFCNNGAKAFFKETFATSCENQYDEIYRDFILDTENSRFVSIEDTIGLTYEAFRLSESKKVFVKINEEESVRVKIGSDVSDLIKINPIYFDFGKSLIRPDAAVELNKIIDILNKNPKMSMELGSHTDCVGNDAFNLKLSSSRALDSVNYIKKKIKNPKRITGKGYGETKLLNKCGCEQNLNCDQKLQDLNRRTEFIIKK